MLSYSLIVLGGRYVLQETASQYYFRFPLESTPNPTRPKSMGKTFICLSDSIAIFQHISAGRLVPGRCYVVLKTASQYYFRFPLFSLESGIELGIKVRVKVRFGVRARARVKLTFTQTLTLTTNLKILNNKSLYTIHNWNVKCDGPGTITTIG